MMEQKVKITKKRGFAALLITGAIVGIGVGSTRVVKKMAEKKAKSNEMKRLKEKAGVAESKIFPHNFRHLFARIYYKVTKDITGLADLLGHSSINVTRIYTATTETVFQKKLDKIVEQEILECTT